MVARKRPFSIWRFLLLVALQLTALFLAFRFLRPDFWAGQIAAGLGAFVLVFLGVHLFICFFEWGFHRYVLHCTIHPWLAYFSRSHRNHHALTPIKFHPNEVGRDRLVLNRYPIEEEEQYEDAAFPVYALLAFWVLFTPLLIGLQLLIPQAPIMLGGYAAIAWSMTGYEVFHAVEHFPYAWWKRAVEDPRVGGMWRALYGFHHFHHANILANEAISGFFGFPVADWCFGTYHQPKELLLEGRLATAKDFKVQPPWPFVRSIDDWARRRETNILHG